MLLVTLLVALGTLVPTAQAATRTIRLTADGPSPARLSLQPGDRVVFRNDDSVPHQVESEGGWQFDSGPIPPGETSIETMMLTAPGTYRYADTRGVVVLPETFRGLLAVPAPPPPSPSATSSATPKPRPSATPSPTTPTPSPTGPTPSPTSSPTPSATASPSTAPSVGPSVTESPSPLPSAAPDLRYGDPQALVQGSPHRYGLPVLLALVAAGGVASLLARYLLALAPRRG